MVEIKIIKNSFLKAMVFFKIHDFKTFISQKINLLITFFKSKSHLKSRFLHYTIQVKSSNNKPSLSWVLKTAYFHPKLKTLCIQIICVCSMIGLVILPSDFQSPVDLETLKPKDYWGQTGLKLSTLHSIINKKTCYTKFHNFLGCMQAISTLVNSVLDKDMDLRFSEAQIKKGISSISDIQITLSKKKSFQDVSKVLKDFKKSMAKKIKVWKILYHQTLKPQKHIHFYQILVDIITHHQFPPRSLFDQIFSKKKRNIRILPQKTYWQGH